MRRLIVNAHVVTMDAERNLYDPGYVLIGADGRIEGSGPMAGCPDPADAERIDCAGCVVLPGLVDGLHRHWLHLLPDARPGAVPLPGGHALAARIAAASLASGGVTSALLDMPAGISMVEVEAVLDAFATRGLRAVPALPVDLALRFDDALVKVEADVPALAEGRTDEASIRATIERARDQGRRVLIQPWPDGTDTQTMTRALSRRGRSTVHQLMEMGLLDHGCILVCPPVLDDLDRALILESECHVLATPVSDAGNGVGQTAFSALARAGGWCLLGSGGPAPGWSPDMMEQVKMAVMAQNTLMLDPNALSVEHALAMATVQGAAALGLAGRTGAIQPGLDADLAVFSLMRPEVQVAMKPISALVACLRGHQADHVFARGRPVELPRLPHADDLAEARALRAAQRPGAAA